MKPLDYQVAEHLRFGLKKSKCLVCGKTLSGKLLDSPGQMKCGTCGVTYQISKCRISDMKLKLLGVRREEVAKCYCDCFEEVPVYKAYWRERQKPIPIGVFRTNFRKNALIKKEDMESFYNWLWENRDTYRPHYPNEFNWDGMAKKHNYPELVKKGFKMPDEVTKAIDDAIDEK